MEQQQRESICDRTMATQFDLDLPASASYVKSASSLTDAEVGTAVSSCASAWRTTGARRFASQAGRAYAARAERRAAAGMQAEARSDMEQAVALWHAAINLGSGAAMNFLGAYEKGTFNTETVQFIQPNLSEALQYWLKGAAQGNPKSMRNAGVMLLEGSPEYAPVVRNVAEGRSWLQKAADGGELTAAAALGKALFYGYPPEIGKDVSAGLALLTKACAGRDAGARSFFEKEMNRSKYRELLPAVPPPGCDDVSITPQVAQTDNLPSDASSYWGMNGSILYLVAHGSSRKFYYFVPRAGMSEYRVVRGTLFFDGSRTGDNYSGTAFVFTKNGCGPQGYQTSGTVSADQREVILRGRYPSKFDGNCHITNYDDQPVDLKYRPLGLVQAFRVLNDVSDGILNMRTGRGVDNSIVTAIPAGANDVSIDKCEPSDGSAPTPWCHATWRGHTGWVSSCCIVGNQSGLRPHVTAGQ